MPVELARAEDCDPALYQPPPKIDDSWAKAKRENLRGAAGLPIGVQVRIGHGELGGIRVYMGGIQ